MKNNNDTENLFEYFSNLMDSTSKIPQKEQKKVIHSWKKLLLGRETEIQQKIIEILEELKNKKTIHSMYFEYLWYSMELEFYVIDIDKEEIISSGRIIILNDKIKTKSIFFDGSFQNKIEESKKYDEVETIFVNWFKLCWYKVKNEFDFIHEAYLHYIKGKRKDIMKL